MEKHITVLERETVEGLNINPSAIIVDATLGSGGHSQRVLELLGDEGRLIALDADKTAIMALEDTLGTDPRVTLVHQNFRNLGDALQKLNIGNVYGILADLGWRIEQFDGGGKGFSFKVEEPLLMTFGDPKDYSFTAHTIVNEWDEEVIKNILKGYGEERFSGRIARHIVEAREEGDIATSTQLAAIVENAVPRFYKMGKIHPATRTFQALRIAVNDELEALELFIKEAYQHLMPQGRLAIITFHSIEDRIVKQTFKQLQAEEQGIVITKKPITATEEERMSNPRARSAKLRIFEKK